jgi:heme/copper-type cytochrome/quinol oxidase subunit 2
MSNTADDVQVAAGAIFLPVIGAAAWTTRKAYRKAQEVAVWAQSKRYGGAWTAPTTAPATTTAAPAPRWERKGSGSREHTSTTYYHHETTIDRWGKPSK